MSLGQQISKLIPNTAYATIGREGGALYNPDTSHTVPTTGWEYYSKKDGTMTVDPLLSIVEGPLPPCSVVRITAAGDAAVTQPDSLGTYQPTLQWSSGRKVYRNNNTGSYKVFQKKVPYRI